ncbi:MAG: hypothetical protein BWZ02_00784 [Lentisphaerae bacterium ADurb.BinA184]|nr:MAG: hypothetical protein BWZ02_00784 [Lentisphaerae bacterium ADurb.BinA184]
MKWLRWIAAGVVLFAAAAAALLLLAPGRTVTDRLILV